ncbi:MAG TPA: DUF3313 family protein [Steroidobacteraceae bacterium]|jgi:hypothetical protein|nr:DUF3313 family protein [Steroidobacteraceae bacterium]
MKKSLLSRSSFWLAGSCAALILAACSTTSTAPSQSASAPAAATSAGSGSAQQVLPNGLHLVSQTPQRILYVRPGANFSKYTKVKILDCFVAMQKNWQEDYNQQVSNLDQIVTDADIQTIKNRLSTQFKQEFTKELTAGGYPVVDTTAPDVLLLRPALLNIQVTAPDLLSADPVGTIIRSAGSGTLFLELWDPVSKTILARVIDSQADQQSVAQTFNFSTNKDAADAILKKWADNLVKHLDAARAAGKG